MADSKSSSLPCNVGLSSEPFLVEPDEESGYEAHERVDVGEDPDLLISSLQLLLDRPPVAVGGPLLSAVGFTEAESREPLGRVAL